MSLSQGPRTVRFGLNNWETGEGAGWLQDTGRIGGLEDGFPADAPWPGEAARTMTAALRSLASTDNEGFCSREGVFRAEEGWPGRRGGAGDLG